MMVPELDSGESVPDCRAVLRGVAVFLSDGVAQVTVKLVYVLGTVPASGLVAMFA